MIFENTNTELYEQIWEFHSLFPLMIANSLKRAKRRINNLEYNILSKLIDVLTTKSKGSYSPHRPSP
jgi:hypothetical protein